ncbi:glycolipid 2-alpha-mannosyltransferase [Colletotrichum scovillei]|uniref:glycolipid 2-alpha-mannosyltransferase n=1 Tax=Colletotrichum scovillei TaxID=1209932 RepID=UPI0015C3D9FD|nr:glycolipid 2-alpha-mannosyltransferase [Colletotrichum scovillei]KAF4781715.1 glycolipid 2-alpha-mannosyltransferase [Colletotrichum scovillei]
MIRRYVSPRRRPSRFRLPSWLWLLLAFGAMESVLHCRTFNAPRPTIEQDQPFYTSCREPDVTGKRENGVLVMLAKNSELKEANHTVASLEKHFNRWFHYPIVFLNNEPFDDRFIEVLNSTASGGATFEVIPQEDWTFPAWVNQTAAKSSIVEQGARGTMHAGQEGYHHMCRFYSGSFYQLEALQKYKWYWRLEPDVDFLCSITYDPFVEMARRKKVYGFTISLWEEWDTVPSLFRHTAEFKEAFDLASSALWKAMMEPSWLPYPLRPLMSLLPHRDQSGDAWSGCHYWSNFEIADLDFFRGKQYQAFFKALDDTGGFYFERVRFYVAFSGVTPLYTHWPSACFSTRTKCIILRILDIGTTNYFNARPMRQTGNYLSHRRLGMCRHTQHQLMEELGVDVSAMAK